MDKGKHGGNVIYVRFLTSVSHYSTSGSNMHRNISMHQQRRERRRLQACGDSLLKSMGDAGTNPYIYVIGLLIKKYLQTHFREQINH